MDRDAVVGKFLIDFEHTQIVYIHTKLSRAAAPEGRFISERFWAAVLYV